MLQSCLLPWRVMDTTSAAQKQSKLLKRTNVRNFIFPKNVVEKDRPIKRKGQNGYQSSRAFYTSVNTKEKHFLMPGHRVVEPLGSACNMKACFTWKPSLHTITACRHWKWRQLNLTPMSGTEFLLDIFGSSVLDKFSKELCSRHLLEKENDDLKCQSIENILSKTWLVSFPQ